MDLGLRCVAFVLGGAVGEVDEPGGSSGDGGCECPVCVCECRADELHVGGAGDLLQDVYVGVGDWFSVPVE